MKRTVSRESELPAFSIDVADLEVLWTRLLDLFDKSEKIYTTVKIALPSEDIEFDSLEELKAYPSLRGKVTNFSLWFSQTGSRHVSLRSGRFLNPRATVSAQADSESWCAGAVETVTSFLNSHRLWYNWFVSAPLGLILLLLANLPLIVGLLLPKGTTIDRTFYAGWLAAAIAVAIPYFGKARLLPGAVLCITSEEGFIKRRGVELSLLLAALSAVLTIVGWFVGAK